MRVRNEGTIYQDKHGRWWAQLPADAAGRRPKRRAADRDDALVKLHELHAERRQGADPGEKKPTLASFAEVYLEDVIEPNDEPTTIASHRNTVKHIARLLGAERLDELDARKCQRALNAFAKEQVTYRTKAGRVTSSRPRSQAQINEFARLLRSILGRALVYRLITYNPAIGLTRPKGAAPRHVEPLTYAEAQLLISTAQGYRNAALWSVALGLGLRKGELLGLRWADVDYTAGTIAIRRQVTRIRAQGQKSQNQIRPRTKTDSGLRTLPLTAQMAAVLRQHFTDQAEERRAAGEGWREQGLIFPAGHGGPMTPDGLNSQLELIRTRAGLRHFTVHTLRHTVATWLDEAGTSQSQIGAILGHSRKQTITGRYVTPPIAPMRAALERIADALRKAA